MTYEYVVSHCVSLRSDLIGCHQVWLQFLDADVHGLQLLLFPLVDLIDLCPAEKQRKTHVIICCAIIARQWRSDNSSKSSNIMVLTCCRCTEPPFLPAGAESYKMTKTQTLSSINLCFYKHSCLLSLKLSWQKQINISFTSNKRYCCSL